MVSNKIYGAVIRDGPNTRFLRAKVKESRICSDGGARHEW